MIWKIVISKDVLEATGGLCGIHMDKIGRNGGILTLPGASEYLGRNMALLVQFPRTFCWFSYYELEREREDKFN